MTEILRYRWTSFGPMLDEDGPFVTYADHVEALRQASALATPETVAQAMYWYEQGQRDVFAYHPEWTVTDMCKPDCLPCQRLTELITEREKGYEEGQRDALAAAVQRVQAHLIMLDGNGWRATLNGEGYSDLAGFGPGVIAAVKGGQP